MKYDNRMFGSLDIKATDNASRTFEGTLSTSHLDQGNWYFKDIVYPGAFKRTLDHFKKSKRGHVPLMDSHGVFSVMNVYGHLLDAEEQLTGKTLSYPVESGGDPFEVPEMLLNTQWKIIDGPDGDRLLDRLRSTSVRKMSMGYLPIRSEEVRLKAGLTRVLREVKLKEGSVVVFPMNDNADIDTDSVKAGVQHALSFIKQAGLSPVELRALLDELDVQAPPESSSAEAPKTEGLAPTDARRVLAETRFDELFLRHLAR